MAADSPSTAGVPGEPDVAVATATGQLDTRGDTDSGRPDTRGETSAVEPGTAPPAEAKPARRRRSRSRGTAGAAPASAGPPAATGPVQAAPGATTAPVAGGPVALTGRRQPVLIEGAAPAEYRGDSPSAGPQPSEQFHQSELAPEEQRGLDELAIRLQITFRRPVLLREAMTHASWNNERGEPSGPGHDNERLEYLGDAVLELVVGEYLFRRFPGYDEGQLTQLRAALVNTMSLAKLAERLQLGEALLLGRGAAKTGARQLPSLLANCFEAMIGAIFLDQGYRVATRVFLQSIGDLSEWSDENHKGRLQEAAQLRLGAPPVYRVTAIGGPGHRREYRAEALVGGKVLGEGRGSTKQAAEQAAARLAVERLATPAGGQRPVPARARRPAGVSAEPARVRRRVAEVAADRRAVARPAPEVAAAAAPEPARSRGLLGAIRAAAQVLVGRRVEVAPPAPPAAEPAATAAHRSHRGHRGGRGRRHPGSTGSGSAGSPPSGPAAGGPPPSGSAPSGSTSAGASPPGRSR
ncbi:MAG: ribonuclease III [Candidatus Dormibacteria bacterium]